ncbi:hypothetical protein GS507_28855 [Rhodococcus hoagii]|nr:hypothetical protein [Prescottella equi]
MRDAGANGTRDQLCSNTGRPAAELRESAVDRVDDLLAAGWAVAQSRACWSMPGAASTTSRTAVAAAWPTGPDSSTGSAWCRSAR